LPVELDVPKVGMIILNYTLPASWYDFLSVIYEAFASGTLVIAAIWVGWLGSAFSKYFLTSFTFSSHYSMLEFRVNYNRGHRRRRVNIRLYLDAID
jgi:hypothetical protein